MNTTHKNGANNVPADPKDKIHLSQLQTIF